MAHSILDAFLNEKQINVCAVPLLELEGETEKTRQATCCSVEIKMTVLYVHHHFLSFSSAIKKSVILAGSTKRAGNKPQNNDNLRAFNSLEDVFHAMIRIFKEDLLLRGEGKVIRHGDYR